MRGLHILRHPSAPLEVIPGGKHFSHAVGFIIPNESVRGNVGILLQRERRIEDDFDGLVDEVKRGEFHVLIIAQILTIS